MSHEVWHENFGHALWQVDFEHVQNDVEGKQRSQFMARKDLMLVHWHCKVLKGLS